MTISTEATTRPITLRELKMAVDAAMKIQTPTRYDVSPDFYDWLVAHRVEASRAVDYLMGIPIDVKLDWSGIRAEPVYHKDICPKSRNDNDRHCSHIDTHWLCHWCGYEWEESHG